MLEQVGVEDASSFAWYSPRRFSESGGSTRARLLLDGLRAAQLCPGGVTERGPEGRRIIARVALRIEGWWWRRRRWC
jgi:hypothetical protein